MSTDQTTFPSITFPATFEGTAAIGADFSATLKLKTSDGPGVLEDLKALPRGTYDVTIVSRQGALAGDSLDREWSSMELQGDEDAELQYESTCIGGQCPHFAVATAGELEGAYVCELDPEAPVKVVHGETPCPLYPQGEAEGNASDDGVDHLDFEPATDAGEAVADEVGEAELGNDQPQGADDQCAHYPGVEKCSDHGEETSCVSDAPCVYVLWPGETETVRTEVGEHTRFSELIFDYLAQNDPQGDEGAYRILNANGAVIDPKLTVVAQDWGKEFVIKRVAA